MTEPQTLIRPCPACQQTEPVTPVGLTVTNATEVTISYRCAHCDHHWSVLWQRGPHGEMVFIEQLD